MTRLDRFIRQRTYGRFTIMEDPWLVFKAKQAIRNRRDAETRIIQKEAA